MYIYTLTTEWHSLQCQIILHQKLTTFKFTSCICTDEISRYIKCVTELFLKIPDDEYRFLLCKELYIQFCIYRFMSVIQAMLNLRDKYILNLFTKYKDWKHNWFIGRQSILPRPKIRPRSYKCEWMSYKLSKSKCDGLLCKCIKPKQ